MFSNPKCIIKDDVLRKDQKCDSYFQKLVIDENARVNDLKAQEVLATTENPRIRSQEITTDICKELRSYKKNDILEQKRRQQLRTNSYDLRLLQTQLQAALVSQQLAEQNNYLQQQREQELHRKREEDAKWVAECEKAKQKVLEEEEKERQKKSMFRSTLQQQMGQIHEHRKKVFESIMIDREEMQKTLKRIQAEEQAEKNKAQRSREQCRLEMEECVRNREVQRQLEKEQNLDDSERLLAYQKERDDLKKQMEAERKRQQTQRMALSDRIGNELATINKENKRREELLLSLLVEERNAKEDEKYRRNLEKQIRERNQLRTEMETYRQELLAQKARLFQEEERQMREEHMRQMAERDRLEQLSDDKRRRKIMEHNRALREMIETRRQRRAEEVTKRIVDFQNAMATEKEG